MPGEEGLLAGVSTLLEWSRRGAAGMLDQRLHFGPVYKTQFGLEPVVAVTDPKLVLELVQNDRGAFSAPLSWSDVFTGLGAVRARAVRASRWGAGERIEAGPAALEAHAARIEHAADRWLATGRVAFKAEARRLGLGPGAASAVYLLARHPAWQARLRDEALRLGKARPGYGDLRELPVADRVWKETLRLFPVAGTLARAALREVELGAWRLPEGAVVFALIASALRDLAWWPDPGRFDPDRFADTRAWNRRREALLLPPGAGQGGLGAERASAEAKVLLFAMVTRGRFRLEHDYEARHTMSPAGTVSGDVALLYERFGALSAPART